MQKILHKGELRLWINYYLFNFILDFNKIKFINQIYVTIYHIISIIFFIEDVCIYL